MLNKFQIIHKNITNLKQKKLSIENGVFKSRKTLFKSDLSSKRLSAI